MLIVKWFLILFISPLVVHALEENPPSPPPTPTLPSITNLDQIAKDLNLKVFKGTKFARKIKIAILDNGFNGYKDEIGKALPADTVYDDGPASEADKIETESYHGLLMAELVAQLLAKSGSDLSYELHLFNAFGITKFASAVKAVQDGRFDVVLYSQVWEFGGNGDGKGFINAMVDPVVAGNTGAIWLNAAGNFGLTTRLQPITADSEGWVNFKKDNGVILNCRAPAGQTCSLRLVLSWNDFKDDIDTGTDKDLDLFLFDQKGQQVASSERVQKLKEDDQDPKSSIVPRELIDGVQLQPGRYLARAKVKSQNFDAAKDVLRMTASGLGVSMQNPDVGETLLPPADNPGVIVVGASDDPNTSKSIKLKKPDVYLPSQVDLKGDSEAFGSSSSAAMAAALTVLHLGLDTEKSREAVIEVLLRVGQPAPTAAVAPTTPATPPAKLAGTIAQPPAHAPAAHLPAPRVRTQHKPRPRHKPAQPPLYMPTGTPQRYLQPEPPQQAGYIDDTPLPDVVAPRGGCDCGGGGQGYDVYNPYEGY